MPSIRLPHEIREDSALAGWLPSGAGGISHPLENGKDLPRRLTVIDKRADYD